MNPDTNQLEQLKRAVVETEPTDLNRHERRLARRQSTRKSGGSRLVRPDGSPVPDHWSTFSTDEEIVLKDYVFKIAHIGDSHILLEPVRSALEQPEDKPTRG